MRRLTIAIVLAVFALAAAGCGGGDESSGTTDTTATETTTEETTTDASGDLASGDCEDLVNASAELAQAFAAAGGTGDFGAASEFFDRFEAPDEIRADFRILADAYAQYVAALQDIGLETGQTPTAEQLQQFQQALAAIDQPNVAAASERILSWVNQSCPGLSGS
jgi:ABC-type phosphate transport system substrate-binding protein